MTQETSELATRLVERLTPVRRLPSPGVRTLLWLASGVPYIALVVLVMSPRPDLVERVADSRYVIEQLAALVTGVSAAIAAFALVVPGYDRRIAWLPLIPLAIWLGSLGEGCFRALRTEGLSNFSSDWFCLPAIMLIGTVPAIVMGVMLRRGAPLAPTIATALGGLGAAGLGNLGLRLFHTQDASLMVLVWQMGSVLVLSILSGLGGRFLLRWRDRS